MSNEALTGKAWAHRLHDPAWGAALAVLTLFAAWLRARGLNPPSLWLDDQWVALIATRMSWGEYFALRPPTPVGFVALLKFAAAVGVDPERALQIVPFTCAVLCVPAMAMLGWRITSLRWAGLLGAAVLVVNPACADYAVRVKQYSGDVLVSIVLLYLAWPVLRAWSRRGGVTLAAAGIAAVLFSFPSIFVSVAVVHVAVFAAVLRRQDGLRAVVIAAVFDALLVLFYLLMLRGQGSGAMHEYWRGQFMPGDSVGAALVFVRDAFAVGMVGGVLPAGLVWIGVVLVAAGGVALVVRSDTRWMGVAVLVVYVEVLAAAALGRYPVGMPRTDMFSYPLAALLVVAAIAAGARGAHGRAAVSIGCVVLAVAMLAAFSHPSRYQPSEEARPPDGEVTVVRDAAIVAQLRMAMRADDALLLYPHAAFAAGYYADWPVRFAPEPRFAHGFAVHVVRDGALTLPALAEGADVQAAWGGAVDDLIAPRPQRVYFLVANAHPTAVGYVDWALRRAGYQPSPVARQGDMALLRYDHGLR